MLAVEDLAEACDGVFDGDVDTLGTGEDLSQPFTVAGLAYLFLFP